ncbi:UPF0359 membrane protein [Toxocara canis]|uniref:UPF0359 membrane protein n=1 Tax=Toxocara canis TaxID=6265 RepID=A0A0B2VPT4_TOXCA|nr:UPF0359 membrane protein [Toxocara canis]
MRIHTTTNGTITLEQTMSVLSPDNPSTSLGLPRLPPYLETIGNASLSHEPPIDWFDQRSYLLSAASNDDNHTSSLTFFGSPAHKTIRNFCKQVLVQRIGNYRVRYWDLAILIPNILFCLFLIIKIGQVRQKLRQSRSPVFKAFFILVYTTTVMNIVRCLVSMSIGATNQVGEIVDKVLWLVLKFFLLSAELCVLTFGLLFGHLDSRTSIRNVLTATMFISLLHLALQSVLEFAIKDEHYVVEDPAEFNLYAHGGMVFWMISSGVFVIVYSVACLLPYTCIRRFVTLPAKCSFYAYCLMLAILNAAQMIGAALIFTDCLDGMCIVDLTTFAYFTLYTPLVYFVFLRRSLNANTSNGGGPLFSYRKQKDEAITGDLPDAATYYPRFSGLTSPSYDDLFDCDGSARNRYGIDAAIDSDFYQQTDLDQMRSGDAFNYNAPLMMSQRTPDSTVTTHVDFDYSPDYHSGANSFEERVMATKPSHYDVGSTNSFGTGPRHLKGLGPNGTLIFTDDNNVYPRDSPEK